MCTGGDFYYELCITCLIIIDSGKIIYYFQPPSVVAVSRVAAIEREGKYIQHNVGAMATDGETMDEFYLINETERRLEASRSTTSFQSFEMKENAGSPVSKWSQVHTHTHAHAHTHTQMGGRWGLLFYVYIITQSLQFRPGTVEEIEAYALLSQALGATVEIDLWPQIIIMS